MAKVLNTPALNIPVADSKPAKGNNDKVTVTWSKSF